MPFCRLRLTVTPGIKSSTQTNRPFTSVERTKKEADEGVGARLARLVW